MGKVKDGAMLLIGLTGNIAAGKSAVVEVWRGLGATVVDADELARRAVAPGTPTLSLITERWGTELLTAKGELDRAALGRIVFGNAEERSALESIVHPQVEKLRKAEIERARAAGLNALVADIPLLFEVGMESSFDVVVLVEASPAERKRRLVEIRGVDPHQADRMMASQWDSARKHAGATFIITNDGSLGDLRDQAAEVWKKIAKIVKERETS